MSKIKIVTTINNEEVLITNCRKFEQGYYKIGDNSVENSGDCYNIDGKYYRLETGQVVYDNEYKTHVLKNTSLTNGIIGFDKDGYNLGWFTITNKNVIVRTLNGSYYCLNEELLLDNKLYRERLSNGEFYHIDLLDAKEFNKLKPPRQEYKTSLPYDSRNVIKQYIQDYNNLEVNISKNIKDYSKILGDLSFGLEFETIAGYIPDRLLSKTGLIPLRDGSIQGLEYVTVPMSGEKGLQTIVNATKILKQRTIYDETCSLHLHLGNVPRIKEFILAFFKVSCAIQDEIFSMFPLYKKYNFGVKNKNYSKPFPVFELTSQMDTTINSSNIDKNFNVLYEYLSMGQRFSDVNNDLDRVEVHPADPSNNAKWGIRTRYYNHNIIPLIFGNKQTIEFRIHTPTFDINKIIPFIIMNATIVNFTIKYQKEILENPKFLVNFKLRNIVSEMIECSDVPNSHRLLECILYYIEDRIRYTEHDNKNGLIKGNEDQIPCCKVIDWGNIKPSIKIPEIPKPSIKTKAEPLPW